MRESEVLTDVLRYLGRYPGVKVWRNNTGRIADRTGRFVSFGLVGSADVIGIYKFKYRDVWGVAPEHFGQFLAIECKSDSGRQSEAQRNFQSMVESMGGLYILARRVDDLYPWFPPVSPSE